MAYIVHAIPPIDRLKHGWDFAFCFFPRKVAYKKEAIAYKKEAERKGATNIRIEHAKK